MDKLEKHWPKIAIGAVALAVSIYLLTRSSKSTLPIKPEDVKFSASEWPSPLKVVDGTASAEEQKKQLDEYFNTVMKEFMKLHGPFLKNESGQLSDEDFTNIYALI